MSEESSRYETMKKRAPWIIAGILAFTVLAVFASSFLPATVPKRPQQWAPDVMQTVEICEGVVEEEITWAIAQIKDRPEVRVAAIIGSPVCMCELGLKPVDGSIEVFARAPIISEHEDGSRSVAVGRTQFFWTGDTVDSACIQIPRVNEQGYSEKHRRNVILHEIVHSFGWDHAYLFNWFWRVNDEGEPDPEGNYFDGVDAPFHVMAPTGCTRCSSLRGLSD